MELDALHTANMWPMLRHDIRPMCRQTRWLVQKRFISIESWLPDNGVSHCQGLDHQSQLPFITPVGQMSMMKWRTPCCWSTKADWCHRPEHCSPAQTRSQAALPRARPQQLDHDTSDIVRCSTTTQLLFSLLRHSVSLVTFRALH